METKKEPKKEKRFISFGIFADAQYADKKRRGKRNYFRSLNKLNKCIELFNKENLDFVVDLGDLIDGGEENIKMIMKECSFLDVPLYRVLGNHDYLISDRLKTTEKIKKLYGIKEYYYCIKENGWNFLFLNGNDLSLYSYPENSLTHKQSVDYYNQHNIEKPDWDGGVGQKQLTWLENQLNLIQKSGENVIIFCHFPTYPDTIHALWNASDVFSIIDRFSCVKAYFSGHNHGGAYSKTNNTHYITVKGMVETRKNSFAIIKIFADKIIIEGYGREKSKIYPLQ